MQETISCTLFYVQDVRSGFLFLTNPKYLHPCRHCRGCMELDTPLWGVQKSGDYMMTCRLGFPKQDDDVI